MGFFEEERGYSRISTVLESVYGIVNCSRAEWLSVGHSRLIPFNSGLVNGDESFDILDSTIENGFMDKDSRILELESALRNLIVQAADLVYEHDCDNHPDDYPVIFESAKVLDPSNSVCGIVNEMREKKNARPN